MHPVANEVEVPTDEVERYLMQWARPGYTGQREIHLRVRPEAGLQVEFIVVGNEVQRIKAEPSRSPEGLFGQTEPTERQLMVRVGLAQNKHRFRIGMKLTRVLAHFQDGKLMGFEWGTIG